MKIPCLTLLSVTFLFCGVSFSQTKSTTQLIVGKTPVGFESEINDFLRQDSVSFPPLGGYLFTGSSTIRKWGNLQKDFDEITVIQRGFGGSTMKALNYYINYIVLPYKPGAIVVYEGDNDLAQGIRPKELIILCDTFISKVHRKLPKTIIYFLSVKPSFARKKQLSLQNEVNQQLKKLTKKRKKTRFIDLRPLMYDQKGVLRQDFFESDSLHVNSHCYSVWARYMKTKMSIRK
ncbi:MAG: GDSL-type esterase/lipase family protein [Bacteroidota bacterium]